MEMLRIHIEDLLLSSVDELLSQIQDQTRPVVVCCPVSECGHTSIVAVAPQATLLCAVRKYPAFHMALAQYTNEKLVPDGSFYDKFVASFASAGVLRDLIPRALFFAYANYGGYGARRKLARMGQRSPLTMRLDRRVESCFVPDSVVGRVVRHWERQFAEFGSDAVVRLTEEEDRKLKIDPAGLDGVAERHPSWSADYPALYANTFPTPEAEAAALDRLRSLASELRHGAAPKLDVFAGTWAKASLGLSLNATSATRSTWERLLLRAEILARLVKPWHLTAAIAFMEHVSAWRAAVPSESESMLEDAADYVSQYMELIGKRFPVVHENPLSL